MLTTSTLKLFILILVNPGGQGRTTLAILIRVLLELGRRDHLGLDADHGTFALKTSSGEDLLTLAVGWTVGAAKASEIVATAKGLPTVMDTGAGMLASQREILDLLPALRARFTEEGYRTVVLLPIAPVKIGAAGALDELAPKLIGFERFVVENDINGSGEFGERVNVDPVIGVPHLQPGLGAYLFRTERTIMDAILRPEPGYGIASARIADWVRSFASEPHVQALLGVDLCTRALARLQPPPERSRFYCRYFEQVGDDELRRDELYTPVMDIIDQCGWTAKGLRLAADELKRREEALRAPILRVPPLHEPGFRSPAP